MDPVTDTVPAPVRAPVRAAVAVGACLVVLVLLGVAVGLGWAPLLDLDGEVGRALYAGDDRPLLLTALLQVLTSPGSAVARGVVVVPLLVWLLTHRARRTAAWVAVATVLVGPLTTLGKEWLGRLRPAYPDGGAGYDSFSFPSGHASGVACLVTVVLVLGWPRWGATARRWWLVAGVVLVLVVGATRVGLGVHHPSDVLAGWSLGVGWTLLVALVAGGLPGGRAALPAGPAALRVDGGTR